MATEVQHQTEPSAAALVSGIVNDVQDLIKQQVRLTRKELESELQHGKDAIVFLVLGRFVSLAGVIGLCLMVAHLLHWLGAPTGSDPSSFPLWASYAIAGVTFLLGGLALLYGAKKSVEAIGTPLHESARALKETFEWKTKAD
jgi:hypothetical protein